MVSRAYGWTDDQILDLSLIRFRQVLAAIKREEFMRRREAISLMSWQTRQLASFIAAGYMVDPKKGNPALDAAQVLAYDEIEQAQLEEAATRGHDDKPTDGRGDANGFVWGVDEHGNDVVLEVIPKLPKNLPSESAVFDMFSHAR